MTDLVDLCVCVASRHEVTRAFQVQIQRLEDLSKTLGLTTN
jgi:bacterioferritin-associated ferredoxin